MKITALLGAAASATLLGTMLVAAPASAAPAACGLGMGCTYEDAGYAKGHINFNYNVRKYKDVGWWVPTNHVLTNDAASSAFNNGRSGAAVVLWEDENYKGKRSVVIPKGAGIANLGSVQLNDRVSSACFSGWCK